MPSNWSEIPTEVLLLIFKRLRGFKAVWKDYCNGLLVCKNWNRQLEPFIYSSVVIRSSLQHEHFNDTIINNDKGVFVKKIFFAWDNEPGSPNMFKTTFDYLPRLQKFTTALEFSYLPLIDALIEGKLAELKCIQKPSYHDRAILDNYATCVLLLKNRLESVALFDTRPHGEFANEKEMNHFRLFYERISQVMDQLHSLTSLTVGKRTNDNITYVESILKKCVHLNMLDLFTYPDSTNKETSRWTHDVIKNIITPNYTIKSLTIDFKGQDINEFVYYLQCKFLNLDRIDLSLESPNELSSTACSLLVSYLYSIPHVGALSIPTRTEVFEEMLSKQMDLRDNDSPPSWGLDMHYVLSGDVNHELLDTSSLCIEKIRRNIPFLTRFERNISTLGLESVHFLERYGKLIHHMSVMSTVPYSFEGIFSYYLLSLFRNTPNLKYLCFTGDIVYDFEWEHERQLEVTLEKMAVKYGHAHENVFISLSRVLKTVNKLLLLDNHYYNIHNECGPFININMESTTVGGLLFHFHKNTHRKERFFFLNVNTTRHGDLYYVYDTKTIPQLFVSSSKAEFNDVTNDQNIHLSLKFHDLEYIDVKHNSLVSIKLKLAS